MSWSRFVAGQLANPSWLAANLFLASLWNRRNAALNDVAFGRLEPGPADRVLDVGFGGGYLPARVASGVVDGSVAGVDISPAMVARVKRRHRALVRAGRLAVVQGRAEALPFLDEAFTKAVSVNSLFYWRDPRAAFAELSRVLADGALLVLCFTCAEDLARRGFVPGNLSLFAPEEVEELVKGAGFDSITRSEHADRHRRFYCVSGRLRSARHGA